MKNSRNFDSNSQNNDHEIATNNNIEDNKDLN